jgi:phosphotransferase system IIB component
MKPWVIFTIIGVVLITTIILLIVVFNKKNKTNIVGEYPYIVESLGGKENIVSSSFKGSRVNVEVKDKKLVNKETLKQGIVDTVVISSKKVTMVVSSEVSNKVCDYLNKIVDINE